MTRDASILQTRSFLYASLLFFCLGLLGPTPSALTSPLLWGAAIALGGLPHGALDWWLGREQMRPLLGRFWSISFATLYVACALAVVGMALFRPQETLVVFLFAAAWHFGASDSLSSKSDRMHRFETLLRGLAPLTMPTLAWPGATRQSFAYLTDDSFGAALVSVLSPLALLTLCGTLALAVRTIFPGCRPTHRRTVFELFAISSLAVVLPPLEFFAVYFCLLHSPRHLLRHIARPSDVSWSRYGLVVGGLSAVAAASMFSVAAIVGLEIGLGPATVATTFWALAALSAPHILLNAWAERARAPLDLSTRKTHTPPFAAGSPRYGHLY